MSAAPRPASFEAHSVAATARRRSGRTRLRSRTLWLAPVVVVAPLATACGSSGSTGQQTVTVTAPASTPGSTPAAMPSGGASRSAEPQIVAVTSAGALVLLNPANGSITQTLVNGGVLGDEISVTPDGATAYFAQGHGCKPEIESVSIGGGTPTPIAHGELPAVSPDGTKLAFAREPSMTPGCIPKPTIFARSFKLVIRALSSGAEKVLPLPPGQQASSLPSPISHLSWAADNTRLAVSVSSIQDNEGWALNIVDTSAARYYTPPGPNSGVLSVPVTGSPDARRSYLREGIFLPDGELFISRACCAGIPVRNTSRLMWEVNSGGAFVHQVAIGYPNLDHNSLAADSTGRWLLYLAGGDLYVSQDGNRPSLLTRGLLAATWR